MFRRAFLNLIPAVAALALLLGAPAQGAGDRQTTVRTGDFGARSIPKGALRDDAAEFIQNQWGDEDDTPDPVDPAAHIGRLGCRRLAGRFRRLN